MEQGNGRSPQASPAADRPGQTCSKTATPHLVSHRARQHLALEMLLAVALVCAMLARCSSALDPFTFSWARFPSVGSAPPARVLMSTDITVFPDGTTRYVVYGGGTRMALFIWALYTWHLMRTLSRLVLAASSPARSAELYNDMVRATKFNQSHFAVFLITTSCFVVAIPLQWSFDLGALQWSVVPAVGSLSQPRRLGTTRRDVCGFQAGTDALLVATFRLSVDSLIFSRSYLQVAQAEPSLRLATI